MKCLMSGPCYIMSYYIAAHPTNTNNISSEAGERMAREVKADVFHVCSAKTREGVDSLFQTAMQLVIRNENNKEGKKSRLKLKSDKCLLL